MSTTISAPRTVPGDVLEALLHRHLGDRSAVVTDWTSTPFPHQGTNDSTAFFRITLSWTGPQPATGQQTATWIIKHWRAGGRRDGAAGINQPREMLAWEAGMLRPEATPSGLLVPFRGAWRAPDGTEAWLAMEDVSTELAAYPRLELTGDQAIDRIRQILARLASFHAWWEEPGRQAALGACRWLGRSEDDLWTQARTYALALGRSPVAHVPTGAGGPPADEALAGDLAAFLDSRPADEQRLWETLLIDRRPLVDGLAAYPPTLLHGDLDDRNIGLRWPSGAASGTPAPALPELVLIDWEWMALGPAAVDVAKIVGMLSVLIRPGTPIPEAAWTDELPDLYFRQYREAGGRYPDAAGWRRAYGLASIAHGLSQLPATHGRFLRSIRGEMPLPTIAGVPKEIIRQTLRASLSPLERAGDLVIDAARRWLG